MKGHLTPTDPVGTLLSLQISSTLSLIGYAGGR